MKRLALALAAAVIACAALAQEHPNLERGFAPDKIYQFGNLDQVNVFNGNMSLTIPLGNPYPVDGGLSYALSLTYNSKVWDFKEVYRFAKPFQDALPNRRSNAGMGWLVSMGKLLSPSTTFNISDWAYESPDGAAHKFYLTLHEVD